MGATVVFLRQFTPTTSYLALLMAVTTATSPGAIPTRWLHAPTTLSLTNIPIARETVQHQGASGLASITRRLGLGASTTALEATACASRAATRAVPRPCSRRSTRTDLSQACSL